MITADDEDAFDLLHSTLEMYLAELGNTQDAIDLPMLLENFLISIGNCFTASSALVRYGACTCLHASIQACPAVLQRVPELLRHVINGCMDEDKYTAALNLAILEMVQLPAEAFALLMKLKSDRGLVQDFDMINNNGAASEKPVSTVTDVLLAAVKIAPPLPTHTFQKMLAALEFLPKQQLLGRLQMIRVWTARVEKLTPELISTWTSLLSHEDAEVRSAALKIVMAAVPALQKASKEDIAAVWRQTLGMIANGVRCAAEGPMQTALATVELFPVALLDEKTRGEVESDDCRVGVSAIVCIPFF